MNGSQHDFLQQAADDKESLWYWDLSAQPMDQEFIPSFVSPVNYIDICACFGWGRFAVGGQTFPYFDYYIYNLDTDSDTPDMDAVLGDTSDFNVIQNTVLDENESITEILNDVMDEK